MESNVRYYARRAAEERTRARVALTDAARMRHSDLAALFESKALNWSLDMTQSPA